MPWSPSIGSAAHLPSVIRTVKIATIEAIEAIDAAKLGRVSPSLIRQVVKRLARELGLHAD